MQTNTSDRQNNVFDMARTGAAISRLRKRAGFTQAELADKLGISYQAVSSWERGASMPDIGKLLDLAACLGTTVDDILSGRGWKESEYAAEQRNESADQAQAGPTAEETKEQIEVVPTEAKDATGEAPGAAGAPLPPSYESEQIDSTEAVADENSQSRGEQDGADTSGQHRKTVDSLSKLVALAPFLEQDALEEMAMGLDIDPNALVALAPFLNDRTLEKLIQRAEKPIRVSTLVSLAPFLSSNTLEKLVTCKASESGGLHLGMLVPFAPFLSSQALESLIAQCDDKDDPAKLASLAPFLGKSKLGSIIGGAMNSVKRAMGHKTSERADKSASVCIIRERAENGDTGETPQSDCDLLNDERMEKLLSYCSSEDIPQLARTLGSRLSEKQIDRLLAECDEDDLPKLADILKERLSEGNISCVLRNCNSEDLPEIASLLRDRLTPAQIGAIVNDCDGEDLPGLAKTLAGRLDSGLIDAMIRECDSEDLSKLADALRGRLSRENLRVLIEECDEDELEDLLNTLLREPDSALELFDDALLSLLIRKWDEEELMGLVKLLRGRFQEKHIDEMLEKCDPDSLLELVDALTVNLKPDQALNVLKRLRE